MPVKLRRRLSCSVLLAAAWSAGGCTAVQPWERGVLARPQMALAPHPMRAALRAHVQTSREAAPPPGPADGGGCGCY